MFWYFFLFVFLVSAAFTDSAFLHTPKLYRTSGSTFLNISPTHHDNDSQDTSRNRRQQYVPVIGPIPGAPPLLLGADLIIDQPTPFQWETLHEAVVLHRQYLEEQSSNDNESSAMTTGIDAAPIVAVIDEVTGKGTATEGRYATLAAVVGISSSTTSRPGLYMSDESSFMESLLRIGTAQSPLYSRTRMVGIGRATLKEFFYKDQIKDNSGDVVDENGEEQETPIVMSEFTVIRDTPISSSASTAQLGNKGARSVYCSPVHAIAEMSSVVNRVTYLHDERRRLVKGLNAAKIRLERANVFEDHDGIGQVTSSQEDQEVIQELLSKYTLAGDIPRLDTSDVVSLENYGMNIYSVLSTIPELTNAALELFEPYYSPDIRKTEEHEMEVASFVAFRALDGFCSPNDLAAALQCTNTVERFSAAYDLMLRHKELLQNMAEYTSRDLRDCGEECTDLW